jgi:ribosome-binding factor A
VDASGFTQLSQLRREEMISSTVRKAISKAVEDLIDLIQEEGIDDPDISSNSSIKEIHIKPDYHNPLTHWIVYATMVDVGDWTNHWTYKYAIYINKETGQAETDWVIE